MYSGAGFRAFHVGDVDVVRHDGLFHLFHLVLPNHDYIAHAVSEDGLSWRLVENALFISDPGAFDDDMLWTMHVTADPHHEGRWRMFYTGLCIAESGRIQRVGMATSDDLYRWEKVESDHFPLEAAGNGYEHSTDTGRQWVSFRDPFYMRHDDTGYLLVAARVDHGPEIRRGCVALAEETAPDHFELRKPLFHPSRYDDVEVPATFELGGRHYLVGSIREDTKVHYWYADDFFGPYRNLSDNVLMPQGNYAARICHDGESGAVLVWNFFFKDGNVRGDHLLPPPKEITAEGGHLRLRSFRGFDDVVADVTPQGDLLPLTALFDTATGTMEPTADGFAIATETGFEAFTVPGIHGEFRFSGTISVESDGKLGLVMHLTDEGDGYYLSIDPVKAIAQIRYWGARPGGSVENTFEYRQLQASFHVARPGPIPFMLISYGTYIELSVHDAVILTLADDRHTKGRLGFYVESARLHLTDLKLEKLSPPPHRAYISADPGARHVSP